ncbi:MAG TPA: hypothetical protein VFF68_11320, partial [Anaerolineaceae bacterium]|nr:hypothetical protein [Anaerolineaceae bacterium]
MAEDSPAHSGCLSLEHLRVNIDTYSEAVLLALFRRKEILLLKCEKFWENVLAAAGTDQVAKLV